MNDNIFEKVKYENTRLMNGKKISTMIEEYECYHQKGGIYAIPVEVFEDLICDFEELNEIKEKYYNLDKLRKIMFKMAKPLSIDDKSVDELPNYKELYKYKKIVDELEKYLNERIDDWNKKYLEVGIVPSDGCIIAFKLALDKIKELKEISNI